MTFCCKSCYQLKGGWWVDGMMCQWPAFSVWVMYFDCAMINFFFFISSTGTFVFSIVFCIVKLFNCEECFCSVIIYLEDTMFKGGRIHFLSCQLCWVFLFNTFLVTVYYVGWCMYAILGFAACPIQLVNLMSSNHSKNHDSHANIWNLIKDMDIVRYRVCWLSVLCVVVIATPVGWLCDTAMRFCRTSFVLL